MSKENISAPEFAVLPDTADFLVADTPAFDEYAAKRPWIVIGEKFENGYIIAYTDKTMIPQIFSDLGGDFLRFTPKLLSPVDSHGNDSAGITRVLSQPFLDLTGQGVLIAIIDTGIDITLPALRYSDGSTRIAGLWDQTMPGSKGVVPFGKAFEKDELNEILNSNSAEEELPGFDADGHGTFLASVAAGNAGDELIGAAPGCELVCVKLREARQYYRRRFLISDDSAPVYESTELMLGVKYAAELSVRLNKPLVICIGLASNTSPHDGSEALEDYLSYIAGKTGYAVCCAAGNEANARHHTSGKMTQGGSESISIRVSNEETSFGTIIFTESFDKLGVSMISPTGEVIDRRPFESGREYIDKLILENTKVTLRFSRDTYSAVWIGLEKATRGIWEIILYGESVISGVYHAWLPVTQQAPEGVEFLRPVPEYTVVFPAAAIRCICCGAYSSFDGSLLVSSSWGPTLLPKTAPDIVSPGVKIGGYYPEGAGIMTGTSVSAAIAAGAAALLMQWGIVKGNMPDINGSTVRSLFIGGASRDNGVFYPNNKWGYGRLDLYGVFEFLRNRG